MKLHRLKRVLAVTAYLACISAFGGIATPTAPADHNAGAFAALQSADIKDQLTSNKACVEFTYVPPGADHIGLALMGDLQGHNLIYRSIGPKEHLYCPPVGTARPVVDAQAWTRYSRMGEWAGRKQTVPGGEFEEKEETPAEKQEREERELKEREEREKTEKEQKEKAEHEKIEKERIEREKIEKEREEAEKEEKPVNPGFFAGINAGYWGSSEYNDLTTLHTNVVRLDTPTSIGPWEKVGLKVIADYAGPYSSSGVSGLNHKAYVERVVNFVKGSPHVFAVEVLNEPGGNWFWGGSAESETNRQSYAQLLIEVHNALVSNFGTARPLELASWDGGHDSSNAWGAAWSKNGTALADVDGVTNHPYGGTGSRSSAILGNRGLVEQAESQSHKPIYVTEVGFPTKSQTGDSLAYTEKESAWAIYHFAEWAKGKGYVAGITFYGYRDSANSAGYGLERNDGSHKPGWEALREFNEGKPCGVC